MTPQQVSPVPASASVSGTSRKLLALLRKRSRQLLQVTCGLAMGLVLVVVALAIWWLTSLNGLPDIGDPFDVAAFRAFRVPEDQNAFTFLLRADRKITPFPSSPAVAWSQADPKLRRWVEANRRAIELFLRGADRSDASNPDGESVANGQRSATLVLLEGSRRQESGDLAGAWDCYRATLRMATHIRRRGSLDQRQDLYVYWDGLSRQRLEGWATDPRTTLPHLHAALEEVLRGEPRPEWEVLAMKAGYLAMMRALERPVPLLDRQDVGWEYPIHLGDMELSADRVDDLEAGHRFLRREPERSRRVLRLLYANWLAHVGRTEPGPRKPAMRASLSPRARTNTMSTSTANVLLYPVDPSAPAGTRSLVPREVARWLITAHDAKLRILLANRHQWPWSPESLRDRKSHHDLVLMLAGEIYRREHGNPAPSDRALVGTYLKSLPDDGSPEIGDDTTPTVADP